MQFESSNKSGFLIYLPVMFRDIHLIFIKRLLNGLNLCISVHIQRFLNERLANVVTDLGLNLFHRLRLEPSLFRWNILGATKPRYTLGVIPGPHWILWRMHIFLQQFFVGRIQLSVRIGLVQIAINQIDGYTQIVFGQYFIFVVSLQRCGIVLDEAVILERIGYKFEIERNVGQGIAVFYTGNQLRSGKIGRMLL